MNSNDVDGIGDCDRDGGDSGDDSGDGGGDVIADVCDGDAAGRRF